MTATLTLPRRLTQLREHVASATGRVDREAGIIRGVKILGKHSANGREYSDKAIDDAVGLYEGARVRLNHPERRDDPARERGLSEEFGVLRNVRRQGDDVFGDLHYIKSHPLVEMVLERAERFPDKIGLRHNAEGKSTRRNGHEIVESIEIVHSVDLVNNPATNRGLFESSHSNYVASLRGRSLAESLNDPNAQPTVGEITQDHSADVDDAVVATLGELLPADTVTQLRPLARNALARVYESAVVVVTKAADYAPEGVNIKATLSKLLEEKKRSMEALDAILLPLDADHQYDLEVDAAREAEGLPPLDGATIESLNRRLDAIAADQREIREVRQHLSSRPLAESRSYAELAEDVFPSRRAASIREVVRSCRTMGTHRAIR